MFFVDKYKPKTIKDAFFHKDLLNVLTKISKDDSIPHIIFYGQEGSGVKTCIELFLERIYNKNIHKLVDTIYTVSSSGSSEQKVVIQQSDYHIVIEPNNNNFDRYLIQEVVKEYAKRVSLNAFTSDKVFKTVLINNADRLPYYAQASLRRTLEKFSGTCRFIMWCRSFSKIIEPLRNRCLCIRVPLPSETELFDRLHDISVKENIQMKFTDYQKIIEQSKRNIRNALWMLQSYKYGISYDTSYEYAIKKIIETIIECNIDNTEKIRILIYQILITNISGTQIIKDLTLNMCKLKNIDNGQKFQIIKSASDYEHNLIRGRRDIIHLEAYVHSITKILIDNKFVNKYNK